ncbi:MAG: response regulator [Labilithrix sp.]|nr:response regulator [Labilithrix sp.]MBX3223877.1 response regulator [Labilithrix sp.]
MTTQKILLVDDSAIVRAVVVHALSARGLEVSTIVDPRDIEDAVVREKPDLLLVDATYPGVTDDELVAAIAPYVRALPVLFFSDRAEEDVGVLVRRSGARGAVPKDGATLADRLTPFLKKHD